MFLLVLGCFLLQCVSASLHHLFVGTVDGGSIYTLELDDIARTLTMLQNNSAAGASPSMALDLSQFHSRSMRFLFGSRPSDGTLSRYSVESDWKLTHEGTMDIPQSCNSTTFTNIKITHGGGPLGLYTIYGSASTGECSALFSISTSGFYNLRSDSIAGDIRSLAWSPNGQHLHALDTKRSSLLDFHISINDDDQNLHELVSTDLIANSTSIRQIITHPVGHRVYAVTQDTNELIDIPLLQSDRVDIKISPNRSSILTKDTPSGQYVTTSLAISSSNATLWTLSHTKSPDNTFMLTVFRLDPTTGAVQNKVARASFKDYLGDGSKATSMLMPAPFEGDMVAVTTYPGAMVAILGLVGDSVKSYGRTVLAQDEGCCGEGVWLD